jgi:hypothetical protein
MSTVAGRSRNRLKPAFTRRMNAATDAHLLARSFALPCTVTVYPGP